MTAITRTFIEQTDPPRPPKETLPTMYDLPSEDPEEPVLPDEFHSLQPRLLDHGSAGWIVKAIRFQQIQKGLNRSNNNDNKLSNNEMRLSIR
jgi:hypothetical protein